MQEVAGSVNVQGDVGARPAVPAEPVYENHPVSGGRVFFGPADPGDRLAIGSLTITNQNSEPEVVNVALVELSSDDSTCSSNIVVRNRMHLVIGPDTTEHLAFPTPWIEPSVEVTRRWCIEVNAPQDRSLDVSMVGFTD